MSNNAVSNDLIHGFERTLIQKQLEKNDDADSARG
jgi:hypothetical protein